MKLLHLASLLAAASCYASVVTTTAAQCPGVAGVSNPTSSSCSVTFPYDGHTGSSSASGQISSFSASASADISYGTPTPTTLFFASGSASLTGDFNLMFLGPDGAGGLFSPNFTLTVLGDLAESGTAAISFNGVSQSRDTLGFNGFLCSGNFVDICGIPFLFNVPIAVHLQLSASAFTDGKYGGVETSANLLGFSTFVNGARNAEPQYSFVPAPEPSAWLLVLAFLAVFGWKATSSTRKHLP